MTKKKKKNEKKSKIKDIKFTNYLSLPVDFPTFSREPNGIKEKWENPRWEKKKMGRTEL